MKLGLVAELMQDGQVEANLARVFTRLEENKGKGCDLLCFGESFLQGFEGLTWDYQADHAIAISQDDPIIQRLQGQAHRCQTAVSFGYVEKAGEKLYSSNLLLSKDGEIVDNFRRVSVGWKEPIVNADERYAEGDGFHAFEFGGKTLTTAICGDLWHDHFLEAISQVPSDLILWPLYVDFSPEDWLAEERQAYAERVAGLNRPVLMINSYLPDSERAKGGCCVFEGGKVTHELPMGKPGMLTVEI